MHVLTRFRCLDNAYRLSEKKEEMLGSRHLLQHSPVFGILARIPSDIKVYIRELVVLLIY